MVSTLEKLEAKTAYHFPKLGMTPRERKATSGPSQEIRYREALDLTSRLLAHSLARATRMDQDWERTFAQGISYLPLDQIVKTVFCYEPVINPISRQVNIESNLGRTRAMETALRSLDLLLQLRLGIPSRQSVKREIKQEQGRPGKNYGNKLDKLRRKNNREDDYTLYEGWKIEIIRRTEDMHQMTGNYRAQLNRKEV